MSKRLTIFGLAAICALALSAVSATSGLAATTAYTCVAGGTAGPNKFQDADCSTVEAAGGFGHTAIAANLSTTLTLGGTGNWLLEGKLFGPPIKIQATGVSCSGCLIENAEVGGVMEVKGTGKLRLTGVTVLEQPNCEVRENLGGPVGQITTEALKFTTTSSAQVVFEPVVPPVVATFDVFGMFCAQAGNNLKLTGKIKATLSGAKVNINVPKVAEELKLEGEKASLKGEGTLKAGMGGVHNPIALT